MRETPRARSASVGVTALYLLTVFVYMFLCLLVALSYQPRVAVMVPGVARGSYGNFAVGVFITRQPLLSLISLHMTGSTVNHIYFHYVLVFLSVHTFSSTSLKSDCTVSRLKYPSVLLIDRGCVTP